MLLPRITLTFVTLLSLAPGAAAVEESQRYPRPELLIEADELMQRLGDEPRLFRNQTEADARTNPPETLLDVRSEKAFKAGTIVTARHVDIGAWKAAFGDGQDAEAWSKRLGDVLLGEDSTVIVFDDAVTPNAARAWWILKYWGVKDVRILNGGVKAWTAAGGEFGPPTTMRTRVPIKAEPHPDRLATAAEVLAFIAAGDNEAVLIDTRTDGENAAGYIPTACHTDWQECVDPATGKIRSAEELGELLARANFERSGRTITYCQSGGRASVVAFATELMGGERVENYFGSWGEWSQLPDAPIARPGK
ncbi:putative thiosulfate sulfurtransferase [Posidoniimonas polymericola]|uniref:Putative thiosulfate sulfurtransferase n=1 Tax=Posidoniimonas polymericola TaxID=2528002 RepID=A0A5C5YTW4_9BACT|nr:rhodanese-like domain-containing protein [Posidoniimonas polymericola]TWT78452.1 putative thiosulfate sulfurtransferase [Posidoniimonas polymericola]